MWKSGESRFGRTKCERVVSQDSVRRRVRSGESRFGETKCERVVSQDSVRRMVMSGESRFGETKHHGSNSVGTESTLRPAVT